ncbi:neural proliferation differentiation and control protein 1a [Fundulus heteroclitus]|uniref:neural proliferation differentiation and control protein 1a n=1 Tax=Fundulus heteroclitus TaxID=8078 RepID=UPI00165CBBA9|nr:neural proliferation differentiation and control protein 1a [Fundulus heteroclitus]
MLLLSGPRCGHQRGASLLLAAALPPLLLLLLCYVPVGASLPAHNRCPQPLDCAQLRRHHCRPGSSHCGSCLSPYRENDDGRCVLSRRHKSGKVTTFTDLDEEIDFLHSIIEKQEVSKIKTTGNQPEKTASISSQMESRTGASRQKSQNQDRLSGEIPRSTAAAPMPAGTALPHMPTTQESLTGADGRAGPLVVPRPQNDTTIVIIISLCVIVGTVAVILASVCYVKLRTESRLAEKVDYPAFKGPSLPATTANGSSVGDKNLAKSAQMYHYQHQKQQMISMGNPKPDPKSADTEVTSDEEEVAGGFTVYECPGLAPTGEMEVKNPLFDDSTLDYQGNPK